MNNLEDIFKGKVLLIIGGTGSVGGATLKRLLNTNIKEIRILSRDENKQDIIRRQYNNKKIKFYIGDVKEYSTIISAMTGADYVIHAAALKQIPGCEIHPFEAVKTNIIGTENVLNAALNCRVKKVVCISTDKAACPSNAMGISKAMMEKLTFAKARDNQKSSTTFCCIRFVNVMCSRSSVIPIFVEQVKQGKNLTVTDPNMTRFFMNLDEAIDLIFFAFVYAKAGDLCLPKSEVATIGDLAIAINELFNGHSKIEIIGARSGESMYETLLTKQEVSRVKNVGKYYILPMDLISLNCSNESTKLLLYNKNDEEINSNNVKKLSIEEIKTKLMYTDYIKQSLQERK